MVMLCLFFIFGMILFFVVYSVVNESRCFVDVVLEFVVEEFRFLVVFSFL